MRAVVSLRYWGYVLMAAAMCACDDGLDTLFQKDIPVSTVLPDRDTTVLVLGFISPERGPLVFVQSVESITRPNSITRPIMDAEVYVLNPEGERLNMDYRPNNLFYTSDELYDFELDKTYEVVVLAEGRTLKGRAVIPKLVPVDSVRLYAAGEDEYAEVTWTDPAGEDNFYQLQLTAEVVTDRSIEEIFFESGETVQEGVQVLTMWDGEEALFTDQGVDGTRFTVNVEISAFRSYFPRALRSALMDEELVITAILASTDKAYYDYHFSLYSNAAGPDGPGPGTPFLLPNRMENGLGSISAYRISVTRFNKSSVDIP